MAVKSLLETITNDKMRSALRLNRSDIDPEDNYLVRNNHRGPATFVHGHPQNGDLLHWQGKGDPNEGDILPVSGKILMSFSFQKALRKGLFSVVQEGESFGGDDTLPVSWDEQQSAHFDEVMVGLDDDVKNELQQILCRGPGEDSKTLCGATIFVRTNNIAERPPLCDIHAEKFSQFFVFEDGEWQKINPRGKSNTGKG